MEVLDSGSYRRRSKMVEQALPSGWTVLSVSLKEATWIGWWHSVTPLLTPTQNVFGLAHNLLSTRQRYTPPRSQLPFNCAYLGNSPLTLQTYSFLISHFCIIFSNSRAFLTDSAIIISPEVSRSSRLTANNVRRGSPSVFLSLIIRLSN